MKASNSKMAESLNRFIHETNFYEVELNCDIKFIYVIRIFLQYISLIWFYMPLYVIYDIFRMHIRSDKLRS